MGHYVNFESFPEKTKPEKMLAWAAEECSCSCDRWENPSGRYGNPFNIHGKICQSREAAEEFLINQGTYVDGAVKYRDTESLSSAKIKAVRESIEKTRERKKVYLEAHSFENQKATLISCKNCGSKLSRVELVKQRVSYCPVCRKSLRSEAVKEKIRSYDKKVEDLEEKIEQLQKEMTNKAKIRWLAKVEVHC